jgi:hypothetical protein
MVSMYIGSEIIEAAPFRLREAQTVDPRNFCQQNSGVKAMSDRKGNLTRREAIKAIGGAAVALPILGQRAIAQHFHQIRRPEQSYQLRFFTPEEDRTIVELTERIIPADERSPGAAAARVNEFIDLMVSESSEMIRQQWRQGLAAINAMSREMFGRDFADASLEEQNRLLAKISRNELSPKTAQEHFFRLVKSAAIDGYYTSEIGIHRELRYKGNAYLKEFVGCAHPEHKSAR